MTMYWIYVIPNWLFSILTVSLFVAFGVAGLYVTRGWMARVHFGEHGHNDIVGFYMAGVTVLYGVSIGLLAIGAWATYTDVQAKVDREAATLAGLYRDNQRLSRARPQHYAGRSAHVHTAGDRCGMAVAAARNHPRHRGRGIDELSATLYGV